MKWILIILSLTVLVSCSGSKKAEDAGEELAGIELNDSEEAGDSEDLFADDEDVSFAEEGEEKAEGEAGEEVAETESLDEAPAETEENVALGEEPVTTTEEVTMDEPMAASAATEINASGAIRSYTVQKNETLMIIAFKVYGDYSKWHSIASQNPGVDSRRLAAGMEIKYLAPAQEFNWNPKGSPYLIKWGDTLGRISGNVYGNQNKWRHIWNNNKPLIKNPNKIFAGFTLYYLESDREVASH